MQTQLAFEYLDKIGPEFSSCEFSDPCQYHPAPEKVLKGINSSPLIPATQIELNSKLLEGNFGVIMG